MSSDYPHTSLDQCFVRVLLLSYTQITGRRLPPSVYPQDNTKQWT